MRLSRFKALLAELRSTAHALKEIARWLYSDKAVLNRSGRCSSCIYSDIEEAETSGQCRRRPPKVIAYYESDPSRQADVDRSALPVVAREDWCGEYHIR